MLIDACASRHVGNPLTREILPLDNTPSASPPFQLPCIEALSRRPGTSCNLVPSYPHSTSLVFHGDRAAASGICLLQFVGSHLLLGALSTHIAACRFCWNCTTGRLESHCRECPGLHKIAAGCAL